MLSGIWHRLERPDRRLRIFLDRPCLELIEQGFGSWLIDFGLILKGSFKSGKQFMTLWCPRQCLSTRGWLNGGCADLGCRDARKEDNLSNRYDREHDRCSCEDQNSFLNDFR